MKPTATEVFQAALQLTEAEQRDLLDLLCVSIPPEDFERLRPVIEGRRRAPSPEADPFIYVDTRVPGGE